MTLQTSEAVPVDMPADRISRKDAATRLGVAVLTVDRYADSGRLTRYRNPVTRRVYFATSEVEGLRREREEVAE